MMQVVAVACNYLAVAVAVAELCTGEGVGC
jgi:hypothetical protein